MDTEPLILNRDIMEWLALTTAIGAVIILIWITPFSLLTLLIPAFLAGNLFGIWLLGGVINRYRRICRTYLRITRNLARILLKPEKGKEEKEKPISYQNPYRLRPENNEKRKTQQKRKN